MEGKDRKVCKAGIEELTKAVLSKNFSLRFRANGFSMLPFIHDNDVLVVSPLAFSRAGLGKVAAYICPQRKKLVVHRIIGIKKNSYFLKGDSLWQIDGLIPEENILGCVTKIERNNKSVHLGLGSESRIIAFLSKGKVFSFLLFIWNIFIPLSIKRLIKCRMNS